MTVWTVINAILGLTSKSLEPCSLRHECLCTELQTLNVYYDIIRIVYLFCFLFQGTASSKGGAPSSSPSQPAQEDFATGNSGGSQVEELRTLFPETWLFDVEVAKWVGPKKYPCSGVWSTQWHTYNHSLVHLFYLAACCVHKQQGLQ